MQAGFGLAADGEAPRNAPGRGWDGAGQGWGIRMKHLVGVLATTTRQFQM